jgi:hypothetical protein
VPSPTGQQQAPRPRPRPRTSDGGRLTASSASAQPWAVKGSSTSLWRAAEHGDVGRLRMLLDAKCDVNAQCPDPGWRQKSALSAAVDGNEPAAVRFLLQRGADPNRRDGDRDRYPLHWAAAFGDHHQVRCLPPLLLHHVLHFLHHHNHHLLLVRPPVPFPPPPNAPPPPPPLPVRRAPADGGGGG